MLAAPIVTSRPQTPPLQPPQDTVGKFADNFAMVLYILCRCPLSEMNKIVDLEDWSRMTLKATPAPELRLFLREVFYAMDVSPSTAAIALYYIYRYFSALKETAAFHTDLRFIIAAMVLSNKINDDIRISLKKWSRLCHVTVADITECELAILKSLEWNVHVSGETFYWWGERLHNLLRIKI